MASKSEQSEQSDKTWLPHLLIAIAGAVVLGIAEAAGADLWDLIKSIIR